MKKTAFGAGAPTSSAAPGARETIEHSGDARSIGRFIRELRSFTDEQFDQVLTYHREHGTRFGEAAVALNLASREDVLWALSQQFHYPYAFGEAAMFGPELVVALDPFGVQAETFRELRSQLLMGVLAPDEPRKALAVVSADGGDGRSYFAANLAIALSQLGGHTLLIDADMRRPRQHRLFDIDADSGLSNILAGRSEIDVTQLRSHIPVTPVDRRPARQAGRLSVQGAAPLSSRPGATADIDVIQHVRDLPGLYVLPVGTLPPNPLELLQRKEFALLLEQVLGSFDHVIVDTPPARKAADARLIALRSGAAIVLGRRNVSAIEPMRKLVAALAATPVRLAGVLINEH